MTNPYKPFREDYEIGMNKGCFVIQRVGSKGSLIFASFTTEEKSQEFLDRCPSKYDKEE